MKFGFIVSALLFYLLSFGQDVTELPLFEMQNLIYKGAFRLPAEQFGISSMNYSQGPIEYNPINESLFVVGHSHHQAIAEFQIPEIVNNSDLSELNIAAPPLQEFTSVLDRALNGNPQNINRIGGLKVMGSELLINGYEYYDADASVSNTTLRLLDANDLANSEVQGFFSFEGGAGQTSGWISSLPEQWGKYLSADYITGQSSGIPIISRTSVGPTAYAFSKTDFNVDLSITTTQLLDFSYPDGMQEDLDNSEGQNDLWTHLSRVNYGFVIPGSRTYMTLGYSGGHESGVCYKCTQDNGNVCGGYCTPISTDNYQYYWLWDMNDLVLVRDGALAANEVEPYDYGLFNSPFQNGFNEIGGGTYDSTTNRLFLSVQSADHEQGTYSNPPVIVVYEPLNSGTVPVEWISFSGSAQTDFIELVWQASEDQSADFYEVQKLLGESWESFGNVDCTQSAQYKVNDMEPHPGLNAYRIKQHDYNGNLTYSKVLKIEFHREGVEVFPNPVDKILNIKGSDAVEMQIFDLSGRQLISSFESRIDLSNLLKGIYLLRVKGEYFKIIKN